MLQSSLFSPPSAAPHRRSRFVLALTAALALGATVLAPRAAEAQQAVGVGQLGFLAQENLEYSGVQDAWQNFAAMQFQYGLGDGWALSLRPSLIYMSNQALASFVQARGSLGAAWAKPFMEGEAMRYNVFSAGLGYQHIWSNGPSSNQFEEQRDHFEGEFYGEYWPADWLDLSANHSFAVGGAYKTQNGVQNPQQQSISTFWQLRANVSLTGDEWAPWYLLAGVQGVYENESLSGVWKRESTKADVVVPLRANWGGTLFFVTPFVGWHWSRDNYDLTRVDRNGLNAGIETMVGFF